LFFSDQAKATEFSELCVNFNLNFFQIGDRKYFSKCEYITVVDELNWLIAVGLNAKMNGPNENEIAKMGCSLMIKQEAKKTKESTLELAKRFEKRLKEEYRNRTN
jgi:hypothetical protein